MAMQKRGWSMIKRMAINIGGVTLTLSFFMFLAALSSILLARLLSPQAFGQFALFRTIVLFLAPLAVWGQDIAVARYFSQNRLQSYRWRRAVGKILFIALLIDFAAVLGVKALYDLSMFTLVVIFFTVFAYTLTMLLSNLVRSQQRYRQAIFMLSGFRGLFFLFILVSILFGLDTALAIGAFALAIVLMSALNIILTWRRLQGGAEPVPAELHMTGLIFMGLSLSADALAAFDALFISKILDYEALALYTATLVPAQVFVILAKSAKYVWIPEFGRGANPRSSVLFKPVLGVSLAMVCAFMIGADLILHLLYDGKYDQGAPLLRLFALAGGLKLIYGLTSSIIVGQLRQKALLVHLYTTLALLLFYGFLLFFFIRAFGLYGAGFAMLILTVVRVAASAIIIYYYRSRSQPLWQMHEEARYR